jgi:hypothetical protein
MTQNPDATVGLELSALFARWTTEALHPPFVTFDASVDKKHSKKQYIAKIRQ